MDTPQAPTGGLLMRIGCYYIKRLLVTLHLCSVIERIGYVPARQWQYNILHAVLP